MVAYQLSSVLGIVFDAANKAFVPWLFALLKRNNYNEKAKLVKYTYISMLLLLVITIMAFLIGPYMVVLIASEKYKQAGEIIGYLCLGQAFNGMYLMVTNYIFFSKKTKFLSLATIFSGLINVALMLVLIEYNGLVGVAQAYAIGQFLRLLSTWLLSARVYSMPWLTFLSKVTLNNISIIFERYVLFLFLYFKTSFRFFFSKRKSRNTILFSVGKMKKLIIENTYRSLLIYMLYDYSWKGRDYILVKGRISDEFISAL
ncbi:hypothetical protein P4S63_13795 [Pseudoalteromonas sp. B193]